MVCVVIWEIIKLQTLNFPDRIAFTSDFSILEIQPLTAPAVTPPTMYFWK